MLTLILKGTNGCNLNCRYCSLGEKPYHDTVSQDMLSSILDYVCHICKLKNESELNIILHGGEPTMVPIKVYDFAIQYARDKYPEMDINVSMQTNAYQISEEYIKFLLDYDVNVGVSIDGSAKIHNTERKSRSGQDTFDTVTDNIDRMQSAGLSVSCLMVLTSVGLQDSLDYLNYYASRHLHLKINPLLNYGETYKNPELALQHGDYAHYMIRVYEYILKNHLDVTVSPIDKIIQSMLQGSRVRECTFNPDCNNSFICVDQNGDIYPCGKYSDIHEFKLGNVLSLDYDILKNPKMDKLRNRRSCHLPNKCKKCKYLGLCHAGCNAEASIEGKFGEPPYLCEDYQILFEYFRDSGLRLFRDQLVERKKYLMEKSDEV